MGQFNELIAESNLLQGKGLLKLRGLWRGMGVTLAKDVPFAAGYWTLMEPMRALLLQNTSQEAPPRSQVSLPCCHLVSNDAAHAMLGMWLWLMDMLANPFMLCNTIL